MNRNPQFSQQPQRIGFSRPQGTPPPPPVMTNSPEALKTYQANMVQQPVGQFEPPPPHQAHTAPYNETMAANGGNGVISVPADIKVQIDILEIETEIAILEEKIAVLKREKTSIIYDYNRNLVIANYSNKQTE